MQSAAKASENAAARVNATVQQFATSCSSRDFVCYLFTSTYQLLQIHVVNHRVLKMMAPTWIVSNLVSRTESLTQRGLLGRTDLPRQPITSLRIRRLGRILRLMSTIIVCLNDEEDASHPAVGTAHSPEPKHDNNPHIPEREYLWYHNISWCHAGF